MNCIFCNQHICVKDDTTAFNHNHNFKESKRVVIVAHAAVCEGASGGPSMFLAVIANLLSQVLDRLDSINQRQDAVWFQDRRNER